jgi:hypothetical protein
MEVVEYYMDDNPDIVIVQNPLSGGWFIEGQKGESLPYVRDDFAQASKMYQAIKAFNATGVPKTEDKFGSIPKSRFKTRKVLRGQKKEN